jgi:hypothetical protein
MTADPFTTLGLPAGPGLSDDQVRAAWRAIATATHPDREDGGDPARYAAASAAYAVLRTAWGRSEAYADLAAAVPARPRPRAVSVPPAPAARPRAGRWRAVALVPARVRHGRPVRLALRAAAAVALGFLAVRTGAGTPAEAGLVTGAGTWLVLSARGDLAPPPGR